MEQIRSEDYKEMICRGEELPQKAKVLGNVSIGAYMNLPEIPEDFVMNESLFRHSLNITKPIEYLEIDGDFSIAETKNFVWPKYLKVNGVFTGGWIRSLPKQWEAQSINFCYVQLENLTGMVNVKEELRILDSMVKRIPANIDVDRLILCQTPIEEIPPSTKANLLCLRNTSLKTLPNEITVNTLRICGWDLETLPSNFELLDLFIEGCKTKIPSDIKIKRNLGVDSKYNTPLPDGLKVGKNLYLNGSEIEYLPAGLEVGNNLFLARSRIKQIPDDTIIKGKIIF